jgi:hypothetical protein
MATERMPRGVPPPAVAAASEGVAAGDAARRALRVQMLATEHWSLLATRSLSWSEAFARAGMFLSLLSGAVVALALVAQATSFGEGFVLFALLTLPVVLFVGLATYVRLLEINNEDLVWVLGMIRLRRAYLAHDPELASWFLTGVTEDADGVMRSYGSRQHEGGGQLHALVTTPTTIAFVDAMLAAVLASILVVQLEMAMVPAAAIGVAVFILTCVILGAWGYRSQTMARLSAQAIDRTVGTNPVG